MTIVNKIRIGEKEFDISKLSEKEKTDIARRLNCQALNALGYKKVAKE